MHVLMQQDFLEIHVFIFDDESSLAFHNSNVHSYLHVQPAFMDHYAMNVFLQPESNLPYFTCNVCACLFTNLADLNVHK